MEHKNRVRTPAGVRRYGLPEGAWIPGTPRLPDDIVMAPNKPKKVPAAKKTPAKKAPVKKAVKRVPKEVAAARAHVPVLDTVQHEGSKPNLRNQRNWKNPKGSVRAWGAQPGVTEQRKRRSGDQNWGTKSLDYATPKQLDEARKIAAWRSRNLTPEPSDEDIADNKLIAATMAKAQRDGNQYEVWQQMDRLRGNTTQRSQNRWAVFVAYGGVDDKGKYRGWVPCTGCGVKLTWHDKGGFEDSKYPAMELDKIIPTGQGGSYNPQNLMPSCRVCNVQRGNAKVWDNPKFKNSRPKWHNAAFERKVAGIKPLRKGTKRKTLRPVKEVPVWMMPSPPGTYRVRSKSGKARESEITVPKAKVPVWDPKLGKHVRKDGVDVHEIKMSPVALRAKAMSVQARTGDFVTALGLNHDYKYPGMDRHDDEADGYDGVLVIEEVDGIWGAGTAYTVVLDDGRVRYVDPATIERLPDVEPSEDVKAFLVSLESKRMSADVEKDSTPGFRDPDLSKYWTRGEGLAKWKTNPHPYTALVRALRAKGVPGRMVHGLAARYFKRVFGIWPGQRPRNKD